MPKKILSENYTQQAQLSHGDTYFEKQPQIIKHDYRQRAYTRQLIFQKEETYKDKMEAISNLREEKRLKRQHNDYSVNDEPLPKRQVLTDATIDFTSKKGGTSDSSKTLALTDHILERLLPAGYIKANLANEKKRVATVQVYVPPPEVTGLDLQLSRDTAPEYQGIPLKKEDVKHFSLLLQTDIEDLELLQDKKRYKLMDIVLKAKRGSPQMRKKAMRWFSSHVSGVGPEVIFGVILPLMLEPDLEDMERHILAKLIDRAVHQLGSEIKPYTHKIVAAVSPLLMDEDILLRLEARDIIAAVSRSAGLANIITSLRPDLDHSDEFVRNLTARVFGIVAKTLGLLKVLPFVKAVIKSKKSPQARHTGIRIIHNLCFTLGGGNGASILPYLPQLVEVLHPALEDDLLQVRVATANTFSLLADSVYPYGIDSFESILETARSGLKQHRGRGLAAFIRALGSLIALMNHNPSYEEYTNFYLHDLLHVLTREFRSPDDDMKRAILRTLLRLPVSRSSIPDYVELILQPFFLNFWTRKVALDSAQLCRLVIDATCELAQRLSITEAVEMLIPLAKNANENLRRMSVEALSKLAASNPRAFIELLDRTETTLLDAALYAFQEQSQPKRIYQSAIFSICKALQSRIKPHVTVLLSTVLFRMKNQEPEVRLQAADLVASIAQFLSDCTDDDGLTMRKLVLFLYESLGEVYPEVLGSIIGALHSCIGTFRKDTLQNLDNPSISTLLPTLTPILKNRHEKVQENCIKLVGFIARTCAESINSKEWMRVSFDLLDMLKSQRKQIRVAANATFGHIANAIGPQDVLATLLNNLRVQERQLRVCTAVAIGIVADTCVPFTVLPALMNEYSFPDKNVQNGILKSLSFMFEYLEGSMSRDYLFAITPLLQNALTNRDQVHRQIAAVVVRHLALNCASVVDDDYGETFLHFLNLVLPNLYELSPHVIIRIIECIDALRVSVGPGIFMNYIWPGLFHAARKVRTPFWRVYDAAYIQHSDAMVPYYPRIESLPDKSVSYTVHELDVWI